MRKIFLINLIGLCCLLAAKNCIAQAQKNITLGAYYYDGWSGLVAKNIIPSLTDTFTVRKPIWGWVTSSQDIVDKQISTASNYGLSFFCFDWYYPNSRLFTSDSHPLNRALKFYLTSPNRDQLKFCLLVTNDGSFVIKPKDWNTVSNYWMALFKNKQYLTVNGKPLLLFFSIQSLITNFGSPQAVSKALDSLRAACKKNGLPGVTIGANVGPLKAKIDEAKACGFEVLTGYNYSSVGFKYIKPSQKEIPIDTLVVANKKVWDRFQNSPIPFMPILTLNWDPRSKGFTQYYYTKHYAGYGLKSNYQIVKLADKWIKDHPQQSVPEQLGFLYAWNEYNEGAWLTPSETKKDSLLLGIKRALKDLSLKQ